MESILTFEQVCAGYGRIQVLHELSFQVGRGEIFGIIGPNGSGKTTMLNVLTGLIRPTSGRILLDGQEISSCSVDERCRRGLGRTFQIPRPFLRLSVYENVLAAAVFGAGMTERSGREKSLEILRTMGLYEKRAISSGALPLLDRKRLELARAVATDPRVLLLDEVAAGLTSAEMEQIIEITASLKRDGLTIVWIEHILETLVRSADRLMCIAQGRCAALGKPMEVLRTPVVEELYLGSEAEVEYLAGI